ncbi:MAG: hypothetical protein ABSG17_01030 [Spirochaetia bacterium]
MVLPIALTALLAAAVQTSASPLVASLQTILASSIAPADSLGFDVYRWDRFPSILVLDSADFRTQDRMFSRLAFFLEKRGFRGRLLDDRTLEKLHGWNAHDYGSGGLASFFNAAQRLGFVLSEEELSLRDLVLEEGILTMVHERYAPGVGGVLSISRSSSPIERRLLLTHESFHGIFFASSEYRAFCFHLWDSLDPRARSFFVKFLDELGYDGESRYLAVNEFQAYLMQQPARYAPEYFQRTVNRFAPGELVPERTIMNVAHRLDAYLESRFGIRAGRTLEARGPSGDSG